MKKLIIIGAGGCGKEIAEFAEEISRLQDTGWLLEGFLDDNSFSQENLGPVPIIGTVKGWLPRKDDVYLCSISNPKVREKICDNFESKGAEFITLIHPTVRVSPSAQIGNGSILYPNAYVSTAAKIDKHVIINYGSGIGHDALISSFTTISAFCDVTGNVKLGKRIFLGSHVTIAPGVKLSDDAYVALGSAVVSNVAAGKKIMGVPARRLEL